MARFSAACLAVSFLAVGCGGAARYDVLDPVLKGLQNQIHPPRVGTVLVHQGVGP